MSAYFMRSLALLMATCALLACKNESGVDPNKRLNELNGDETRSVCEMTVAQYSDVIVAQSSPEATCTLTGIFGADTEEACIAMRDECLTTAMPDPIEPVNCNVPGMIPATCDITVGELETCYDDWLGALEARDALYDCANAGDEMVQGQLLDFSMPASCESFFARCVDTSMMGAGG